MKNPNKTALVVGGTQGFGLEMTTDLIQKGYTVATISRNKNPDLPCDQYICDVTDNDALRTVLREIQLPYYHLDLVACVVGTAAFKDPKDIDNAQWLNIMKGNFVFVDIVFRHIWSQLKISDMPVGITIGSRFSHSGTDWMTHMLPYICAKYALRGLTHDIAVRFRRLRINNYCVAPMDTPGRDRVYNGVLMTETARKLLADKKIVAEAVINHATTTQMSGQTFIVNHTGSIFNLEEISSGPETARA